MKIAIRGFLERINRNPHQGYPLCIVLLILVSSIDYAIGFELSFSFFYIAPVALCTWLYGRRAGVIFAVVAAVVWSAVDILGQHYYSKDIYYLWNSVMRLCVFFTIAMLVSALKNHADKDYLTGLMNLRSILSVLHVEINRFKRYQTPFVIGLLDIDNFKKLNDSYGHLCGDHLLQVIATIMKTRLRSTDSIARIGGDEFVFILPQTRAVAVDALITEILCTIDREAEQWQNLISASIGVVCCETSIKSSAELIQLSDELMYSVKNAEKNGYKMRVL